jgi:hypothetical protein
MADISKVRQLAAAEADKPSRTTAALRAIAHEKAEVTTKKGTAKTPPKGGSNLARGMVPEIKEFNLAGGEKTCRPL